MKRIDIMRLGVAVTATLALSGCLTTSAEEDPTQIKLNDLDVRLTRIEKAMANQNQVELSNQLEALRADVRSMHNDVDQLNNNLEVGRRQQRDLYADLDQRMKLLESHGAVAPVNGTGTAGADAAIDDKAAYQAAFTLMKDGQYDRAIVGFQKFLATNPDSALADNAQYWLGEAHYVKQSFTEAQADFQRVIDKFPQSRKLPDAWLKVGYCRYELKEWDGARLALSQVVAKYPDAAAAKLAQARLDKMAAELH